MKFAIAAVLALAAHAIDVTSQVQGNTTIKPTDCMQWRWEDCSQRYWRYPCHGDDGGSCGWWYIRKSQEHVEWVTCEGWKAYMSREGFICPT